MSVAMRPRLCFVAHFAYGALTGGASGHIGGVEGQAALMSRWFADHGYSVSVVTWDEGQPDATEIDGVRVIKLCQRDEGLPGLRFIHPRWTSLLRALRCADADLSYQNCGEYVTGQVAMWCRWAGRRFVYSVASDADCDAQLPAMTFRERLLYRYGLRHADRVVVQTRTQARMLQNAFARTAVVIPMPGMDMGAGVITPPPVGRPRVLWLGRVTDVKRPDRLVDLAEICPDLDFDLVGPDDGTPYAKETLSRAHGLQNVLVHGRATADVIQAFLRQAVCLVSTSEYEGFPNAFLEAWSAGVPVVATVDPDAVISTFGLGTVARDVPLMAAAIRDLVTSPTHQRTVSLRARKYFVDHHSAEHVLPEFERVFLEVVGTHAGSARGALVPRGAS
jgi:glycosyltransferase involved in cell wall biosynthesis